MAAINTIAKEWAGELRDGIAWVIVWKTGRSWNATAVWLNSDNDTFEPEDLERARKILEQDPNAVMLNGYYCGHFGEDMTVAELAAGIRWHYENGYNLLDGSTAFPPGPMEHLADQQQETDKCPAPSALYIDGKCFTGQITELTLPRFSPPELNLPELRSPPSMELNLTITPNTAAAILEDLQPAVLRFFEALVNAAREAWAGIKRSAKAAGRIVARIAGRCIDAMLYKANDHPKWWHYYKHAKKYRVRKKYRRRLEQQLCDKLLAAAAG
nr:hypothetical protein [uncultured Acetatifactor sp.]